MSTADLLNAVQALVAHNRNVLADLDGDLGMIPIQIEHHPLVSKAQSKLRRVRQELDYISGALWELAEKEARQG